MGVVESNRCRKCNQPINDDLATCWPCYYEQWPSESGAAKNWPCSHCGASKRGRDRYCKQCDALIYPSEEEIETALVELQRWIS